MHGQCQSTAVHNYLGAQRFTHAEAVEWRNATAAELPEGAQQAVTGGQDAAQGYLEDGTVSNFLRARMGLHTTQLTASVPPNVTAAQLHEMASTLGEHHHTDALLLRAPGHALTLKQHAGTWMILDSMAVPVARATSADLSVLQQGAQVCTLTNVAEADLYFERQQQEHCMVHSLNMMLHVAMLAPAAVASFASRVARTAHDRSQRPLTHYFESTGNYSIQFMQLYLWHNPIFGQRQALRVAGTLAPGTACAAALDALLPAAGPARSSLMLARFAAAGERSGHARALCRQGGEGVTSWWLLDSMSTGPKQLRTPEDWAALAGEVYTLSPGDARIERLIPQSLNDADPLLPAPQPRAPEHVDLTTQAPSPARPRRVPTMPAPAPPPHNPPAPTGCEQPPRVTPLAAATEPTAQKPTQPAARKPTAQRRLPATTRRPAGGVTKAKQQHKQSTQTSTLRQASITELLVQRARTVRAHMTAAPEPPTPTPFTPATPQQPPASSSGLRQITALTLNVRGLRTSQMDLETYLSKEGPPPDIIVLTETHLNPKASRPPWLHHLLRGYKFWDSPGARAGVVLAISTHLALTGRAALKCTMPGRTVVVALHPPGSAALTIVATYWPSGSSAEALQERSTMEDALSQHLTGACMVAGDMNATLADSDRSSGYPTSGDHSYRTFVSKHSLEPVDRTVAARPHTYRADDVSSRIDDVLVLGTSGEGATDTCSVYPLTGISDHQALFATVSLSRLGIMLPTTPSGARPPAAGKRLLQHPIAAASKAVAERAISATADLRFRTQGHRAHLQSAMSDVAEHSACVSKQDGKGSNRMQQVRGVPAQEWVDSCARTLDGILRSLTDLVFTHCPTKILTPDGHHHRRRTASKQYKKLMFTQHACQTALTAVRSGRTEDARAVCTTQAQRALPFLSPDQATCTAALQACAAQASADLRQAAAKKQQQRIDLARDSNRTSSALRPSKRTR